MAVWRLCITIFIIGLLFSLPAKADTACPVLDNPDLYIQKGNADFARMIVGADGWLFRSKTDLKQDFPLDNKTRDYFYRLNEALKVKGISLVIVPVPPRGIVHHDKILTPYDYNAAKENYFTLLNNIRDTGMLVPDMRGIVGQKDFFWKDDYHWNEEGAGFTAQKTAELIRDIPAYKTIKQTDFVTRKSDTSDFKQHVYQKFYNKICGSDLPVETSYKTSVTEAKNTTTTSDDLFSDNAEPEIVLLGTSNSTNPAPSYANFEGFLKERLNRDISNRSIAGGGFEGSLANYVLTSFPSEKPKIIIWEANASNNFNKKDFFREIIPAIYGQCSNPIVKSSGDLTTFQTKIFPDLSKDKISGADYYLSLKLTDTSLRSIKIRFNYPKDISDTVLLSRPLRSFPQNPGIFYAELSADRKMPLTGVALEIKNPSGQYSAQICRAPMPSKIVQNAPSKPGIIDNSISWVQKTIDPYLKPYKYQFSISSGSSPRPMLNISGYSLENINKKLPPLEKGIVATGSEAEIFIKQTPSLARFEDVEGQADPIVIYSGVYDIPSLIKALKDSEKIIDAPNAYILSAPLVIYPKAALVLRDLEKPLYLSQERGAYISSAGKLFIINSQIAGWNETARKVAQLNSWATSFRPFIITWQGGETYAANSRFTNLGYDHDRSQGFVFKDQSSGWLLNNSFDRIYSGFYSSDVDSIVVIGNKYTNSERHGIDLHDHSENMVLANNIIEHSKSDGILITDSTDNYLFDNSIRNNSKAGIHIRNGHNITIRGGDIKFNNQYAFIISGSKTDAHLTDIDLQGNTSFMKTDDFRKIYMSGLNIPDAALKNKLFSGDLAGADKKIIHKIGREEQNMEIISRY